MKNKAPASVQITAEQLLREAKERQLEVVPPVSKTSKKQFKGAVSYFTHMLLRITNLKALGQHFQV